MNDARTEILERIRGALGPAGRTPVDADPIARDYERQRHDPEALDQLAERLTEYRARVEWTDHDRVGERVAALCAELALTTLVAASGVPAEWRPKGVAVADERAATDDGLDLVDGVLTGCAVAVAETGTIVLDGGPRSGRRAITLVPDHHICVVQADQVVSLVPEAFARLEPAVRERRTPVTLISGPSATSDIELRRVEGVHGPRHLIVLLVRSIISA
jgi:L-lactate dehydrogenase complex protein LldG